MIYYLATAKHTYTITPYLRTWEQAGIPNVQVVPYTILPKNAVFPLGAYIFTDMDRLTSAERAMVADLWRQLEAAGEAVRLLNHPERSLRRYDLLRMLHDRGTNRFNVYRATEAGRPWRFPVFLRRESEHNGSMTPLIHDQATLDNYLAQFIMQRLEPYDALVVEFCDTQDQGVYRKFSAFRVGQRIVPRHVLFSHEWMVKDLDLLEPEYREQIKVYCRDNPHEEQLRAIFDLAQIEYGRIDYGLLDGAIQVWEINTNPIIVRLPKDYPEASLPFHRDFAERFTGALQTIDHRGAAAGIAMNWSEAVTAACRAPGTI